MINEVWTGERDDLCHMGMKVFGRKLSGPPFVFIVLKQACNISCFDSSRLKIKVTISVFGHNTVYEKYKDDSCCRTMIRGEVDGKDDKNCLTMTVKKEKDNASTVTEKAYVRQLPITHIPIH